MQLTHAGVIANARALHQAIPAYRAGFSAVCYLPLAHIGSRVLEHYFGLLLGATLPDHWAGGLHRRLPALQRGATDP